jgi:hypothetical protein
MTPHQHSLTLASDYSQMVAQALILLFFAGGVAIILGAATSAILVSRCHRKGIWFLVPVFAAGWFGLIIGLFEILASY